jgi:hypothetical protein
VTLRKATNLLLLPVLVLGGCESLPALPELPAFRGASVLYQTPNSIGVRYEFSQSAASVLAGDPADENEGTAIEMISQHCQGEYKVTGRDKERGFTTIDAVCG